MLIQLELELANLKVEVSKFHQLDPHLDAQDYKVESKIDHSLSQLMPQTGVDIVQVSSIIVLPVLTTLSSSSELAATIGKSRTLGEAAGEKVAILD